MPFSCSRRKDFSSVAIMSKATEKKFTVPIFLRLAGSASEHLTLNETPARTQTFCWGGAKICSEGTKPRVPPLVENLKPRFWVSNMLFIYVRERSERKIWGFSLGIIPQMTPFCPKFHKNKGHFWRVGGGGGGNGSLRPLPAYGPGTI